MIGHYNFSINNISKSLDMNFISIKNMKRYFGIFYFQVRESPTALRILIPTPAPDHLLGGHSELKTTSVG